VNDDVVPPADRAQCGAAPTTAARHITVVALLPGLADINYGERSVTCVASTAIGLDKETSMNVMMKSALAVAGMAISVQATAQVTFFEREGFAGRSFTATRQVGDFENYGFNDRASSVEVQRNNWEVCERTGFSGRCVVLRPGRYPSLAAMGLNDRVSSVRAVGRKERIDESRYAPAPLAAQVTFYEQEGFLGQSFTTDAQVENFARSGFNDRASSAIAFGERWEVCEDARFRSRCVVLRPGRYPSLAAMGLNNSISSVRAVGSGERVDERRYAPEPVPVFDSRRRGNERLYEADVTSVRAVVGTPEQRCWIEKEQVVQEKSGANVPGAIIGAVLGGVLGHQVGGGRGQDIATVGGVVVGGVIGANVGRDGGGQVQTRDVQRCENLPSRAQPDYWDVTYDFRGQQHRMQMTSLPGATVTVNAQGEPRNRGWSSYADFTFGGNNNDFVRSDRNKAREIASYMEQNPSQRIALDSSNANRVGVVRTALIDAGVPANRIDIGAFGDPQYRRDGRVEVLVSN